MTGPHFCSEQVTRAALAQVGRKRKTRWGSSGFVSAVVFFLYVYLLVSLLKNKSHSSSFHGPRSRTRSSFSLSFVLSQKSLLLFDFHPLIVRGQQFDDISFSSGHRRHRQFTRLCFFRLVRAVGAVDD